MIVNFQVKFANSRVQQIVTNLKRNQSPGYATRIKMADLAERALEFLKSHFPMGTSYPKDNENEETAYSGHLQSGWKVETLKSGQMFGFDFRNVIAERNEHAKDVLAYLDIGTKAQTIELQHGVKFKDRRVFQKYWGVKGHALTGEVVVERYRHFDRPKREGLHYYDKTRQDILLFLLPEIKDRIRARLTAGLSAKPSAGVP